MATDVKLSYFERVIHKNASKVCMLLVEGIEIFNRYVLGKSKTKTDFLKPEFIVFSLNCYKRVFNRNSTKSISKQVKKLNSNLNQSLFHTQNNAQ